MQRKANEDDLMPSSKGAKLIGGVRVVAIKYEESIAVASLVLGLRLKILFEPCRAKFLVCPPLGEWDMLFISSQTSFRKHTLHYTGCLKPIQDSVATL